MFASCWESAISAAAASAGDAKSLEGALLQGLRNCAAVSADCVRLATAEAAAAGSTGAVALDAILDTCRLQPADLELPCTPLEPRLWMSRLWSFLGWYNAVQLIVMPWVFLWIFSGTVVALFRFLKFQYQLVVVGMDVLIMSILFILISIEDFVIGAAKVVYARFRRSFRERRQLVRRLQKAKTYSEHKEAQAQLSDLLAKETFRCRGRHKQALSNSQDEQDQLLWLTAALDKVAAGNTAGSAENLALLEPLIVREAGGIDWLGGPRGEHLLKQISKCLHSVCEASEGSRDPAARTEMLGWLQARQKALGITALCLSGGGSLAMYHMGVCRFLLEEGLMPEVISGVSGGSIVAAFLAIHTDEELLQHVLVPEIVTRHLPCRWFPPLWQELMNFIRKGILVPTEYFERTADAFYGTWTFEEAYARTGRSVSVVVSSNFSEKLPACIMLNHMTAPRVTIASAVATSCAAVGIMKPRGLIIKDAATGELRPFEILGKSFADGTFVAEVPKDYLRSFYGATQFLVSQVNPHVSAFLGNEGSHFQTLRSYIGKDLQRRARLLSEYSLLPSFFGRAMCKATKHLSQDFGGPAPDGLTVFPPDMGLLSVKAAVSNPSVRDMEHYVLEGQRMAWKRAPEIRARMGVEVTVAHLIRRLQEPRGAVVASPEQPPPNQSDRRPTKEATDERRHAAPGSKTRNGSKRAR
eukprot:TRINITY_DN30674_c0_g1_i1.p1 TRINITY_DN30674_c0_g1~~TRINITY_DN30674_c0_g1_i1.p1  ORF type:complete len:697 (-),score=110.17 TRINITY_DN30674_c0_g1_i1:342-2432(-)